VVRYRWQVVYITASRADNTALEEHPSASPTPSFQSPGSQRVLLFLGAGRLTL
jgi:hypothetical protein